MLLWDSRVLHCSSPGLQPAKADAPAELTRVVSLICMMPRKLTPPDVMEWRKHEALPQRIGTTNWTDRIVNADEFPNIKAVEARDAERGVRKAPLPHLSKYQLRLVGFKDNE